MARALEPAGRTCVGRRAGERGSVLLEVALAVPALLALALALAWAVSLGAVYIRALDVAQSVARQVARGAPASPAAVPEGAVIDVIVEGPWVRARVTQDVVAPVPILSGISVRVSAEAVAATEPGSVAATEPGSVE